MAISRQVIMGTGKIDPKPPTPPKEGETPKRRRRNGPKAPPRTYRGTGTVITMSAADLVAIMPEADGKHSLMSPVNSAAGVPLATDATMMGMKDWYGGATSLDQMRGLFTDGWVDGAARVSALADGMAAPEVAVESVRRRRVMGEEGDSLDPFRALAGDWDIAWETSRASAVQAPRTLTLATGWGGSCNRTAEQLFWSGAQALAITSLLEAAGYTVELLAIITVHCNGADVREEGGAMHWNNAAPFSMTCVTMKEADEPVRFDTLAATICHAGTFRTAGFTAISMSEAGVGHGLGRPVMVQQGIDRAVAGGFNLPHIDHVLPDALDERTAKANVAAFVKRATEGVFHAA